MHDEIDELSKTITELKRKEKEILMKNSDRIKDEDLEDLPSIDQQSYFNEVNKTLLHPHQTPKKPNNQKLP